MATSIKLSQITKVSLRSCWQNEVSDFTPWLASEENISLLADALDMNDIEVKAQEEHVGPFRADILVVDHGTDQLWWRFSSSKLAILTKTGNLI